MLIDDNDADNHYHQIVISRADITTHLKSIESSRKALEYLRKCFEQEDNFEFPAPELIFLDINMPAMNGFELLDELRKIPDPYERKGNMKVFMLTGSLNPDDYKLAIEKYNDIVTGFRIKPLTDTIFTEIVRKYF